MDTGTFSNSGWVPCRVCSSATPTVSRGPRIEPRFSRWVFETSKPLRHRHRHQSAHSLEHAPTTDQSGALWLAGDVVAQQIRSSSHTESQGLDLRRSGQNALYGGMVNGTIGHWWYRELDRWALRYFRGGSARFVAAKVAADGLVFGPVHVAGYLGAMSLMSGKSPAESGAVVREKFAEAYGVELLGWSVVQAVNFRYVPSMWVLERSSICRGSHSLTHSLTRSLTARIARCSLFVVSGITCSSSTA